MDAAIQWALFSCAENTTRVILCHFSLKPFYFWELQNYYFTDVEMMIDEDKKGTRMDANEEN